MPSKTIVDVIKYTEMLSPSEMIKWALRNVREVLDVLNISYAAIPEYREMVFYCNLFLIGKLRVEQMR